MAGKGSEVGPNPSTAKRVVAYHVAMSSTANDEVVPHGIALLARDLTPAELRSAPILVSIESLLIEGLSVDEDDAFAAALDS